ncbi:MAG: hypothetical protein AB8F95_08960 [Bacteroidia bacterium]
MEHNARKAFNATFTEARYKAFMEDLNAEFDHEISFRVAESPVFVPRTFKHKLMTACYDIMDFLVRPDFKEITKNAVPPRYDVPNENDHTLFLCMDFAVCQDQHTGEYLPQLIEFQGCPSLYGYQHWVAEKYRKHFPEIPSNYLHLARGMDEKDYIDLLKLAVFGDQAPEHTILLEVDPLNQNTNIDFLCHESLLGIKTVDLCDVIKEGRKLFYMRDGVKTPIRRIYNRTIFDDVVNRKDLNPAYKLTDDVDVEWAGHPNWFFRISKYTMPFLESRYVPDTKFLNQTAIPRDLENYVLKPLFSFAGEGVVFDVQKSDIEAIPVKQRNEWILQRKVHYAPVVAAADGGDVKCEIRVLAVWPSGEDRPRIVTNLARLSRGKLIGVKYNKNKTWVGGTVCFFEPD